MKKQSTTINLFKNVIVFTDLHVGLKHNAVEHNEDCVEYIEWFIDEGKKRGAETCICMGDFHHHRSNINILSLNYSMHILKRLNDSFEKTYLMVGNHDLFYREKRDIHSLVISNEFQNIILVDNPTIVGDVGLIPWLVEEEWQDIAKIKSKYIFGHLELPGFKMNANIEMPDHGRLNAQHFKHQDHVFSGHFHMRQTRGKVTYIGNPFGHNYADAWDFDRGAMFLSWGGEPEFINYESGPRFINIKLSSLLEKPELYLKPKTYLQVVLDIDISYEEALFLRESFVQQYNVRELKLIKNSEKELTTPENDDIEFKTVDQTVIEQLSGIESDSFDINTLINIYNRL